MNLAQLQEEFFQAVLGRDNSFSDQVVEQGGISRTQRVHIYRNAYVTRLYETLETDHEILGFYLGDSLFDQMVHSYVESYPSHHRSLRYFGQQLPDFLSSRDPFCNSPVIAELASFERLLLAAFDAAEGQRASIELLQRLDQNEWPDLRLRFHPSAHLFTSNWNCVEIWQALKAETTPPDALEQTSHWCIWRNKERLTEFFSMTLEEHRFATLVFEGEPFTTVCESLAEIIEPENVSRYAVSALAKWFDAGLVSEISVVE